VSLVKQIFKTRHGLFIFSAIRIQLFTDSRAFVSPIAETARFKQSNMPPIPPPPPPPHQYPPPPPLPTDGVEANVVIQFFNDPQGVLQRVLYVAILKVERDAVKWKRYAIRGNQSHDIFEVLEMFHAWSLPCDGWRLPGRKFFMKATVSPEAPVGPTGPSGRVVYSFNPPASTLPFLTLEQKRQILALQSRLRAQAALASTGRQASASART